MRLRRDRAAVGAEGQQHRTAARDDRRLPARVAAALPRRPADRPLGRVPGRGDRAREADAAPAAGAAVRPDCRHRAVQGRGRAAAGQRRDLGGAQRPEGDRHRQRRRAAQGSRPRGAPGDDRAVQAPGAPGAVGQGEGELVGQRDWRCASWATRRERTAQGAAATGVRSASSSLSRHQPDPRIVHARLWSRVGVRPRRAQRAQGRHGADVDPAAVQPPAGFLERQRRGRPADRGGVRRRRVGAAARSPRERLLSERAAAEAVRASRQSSRRLLAVRRDAGRAQGRCRRRAPAAAVRKATARRARLRARAGARCRRRPAARCAPRLSLSASTRARCASTASPRASISSPAERCSRLRARTSADPAVCAEARVLLRAALDRCLEGKELRTRQVMLALRRRDR